MRADVLRRLREVARLYAAEADRRGVAGQACETAYEAIRGWAAEGKTAASVGEGVAEGHFLQTVEVSAAEGRWAPRRSVFSKVEPGLRWLARGVSRLAVLSI